MNPSKRPISTDKPLDEVLRDTRRYDLIMLPLDPGKPETTWMQLTPKAVEAVRKLLNPATVSGRKKHLNSDDKQATLNDQDDQIPRYYTAHAGVYVGFNQVYYVKVKGTTPDGRLVITNPPEPGQKKSVKQLEAAVESELVYPLVRGRDVKKWFIDFQDRYIILPHDPKTAKPLSKTIIKTKFPNAYDYFNNFKKELEKRSIHILWGKNNPFYTVYDIGTYTFAPYKVVWKRIAGAITGKAVSFACAVITSLNGRPVIVDDSTILVNTSDASEAYYLAGFLNSLLSRTIIASYSYELRQETHIVDIIKIPKFNPLDKNHIKIAELSKRAHELSSHKLNESATKKYIDVEKELEKVEREVDFAVTELIGLSEEDLSEFARLMAILSGEEPLTEAEEVETPEEPIITVSNTLLKPNTPNHIEIDVVNPQHSELEISYEFPWETGTFRIVEGKHILPIPPQTPGKYVGKLRYVVNDVQKTTEVVIEV